MLSESHPGRFPSESGFDSSPPHVLGVIFSLALAVLAVAAVALLVCWAARPPGPWRIVVATLLGTSVGALAAVLLAELVKQ